MTSRSGRTRCTARVPCCARRTPTSPSSGSGRASSTRSRLPAEETGMSKPQAGGAPDRHLVISTDCHAGLPPERYRDYLDPRYRAAFDQALPIQLEMTRAAEKQFLVADINAEWRRGREAALSGAWDHDQRTRVMDGDGVAGEVIFPDGITEMNAP